MWSYISVSQNLKTSDPYEGWMTTKQYNETHAIPTAQVIVGLVELIFLVGAIALLVLSQQSWPQDFWLNHSSVWIASLAVCGVCGLDALIALAIKGCCQNKRPSLAQAVKPVVSQPAQWEAKILQQGVYQEVSRPLCEALAKQGIDANNYDLVVMRKATRSSPSLFAHDGDAADFVLSDTPNNNPLNLRNYSPEKILIVTHYVWTDEEAGFEKWVANHASYNSDTPIEEYLNGQYAHVHLNQHDLEQLQRNGTLSPQAIQVLQKTQ